MVGGGPHLSRPEEPLPDFDFSPVYDGLKRDAKIEGETGTELGLEGGITLIVLAALDTNSRWKAKRLAAGQELNRLRNAHAPIADVRARTAQLYADAIVIGWYYVDADGKRHVGPLDRSGDAIPFTREACVALLTTFDDAFAAVEATVYDSKNFRGARIEAIVDSGKA